jgi:hypothetical protein
MSRFLLTQDPRHLPPWLIFDVRQNQTMKYAAPDTVLSPRDYVSNVEVLFDGGEESFSVARLDWEGASRIAIRWNVARREWEDTEKEAERKVCVGVPSSHGHPVWFVLPDELLDSSHEIWTKIRNKK